MSLNLSHTNSISCRFKNLEKHHEDISAMKRTVRSYLKPYWPLFLLAVGQVFFISALELLKPWPLKIILDNVLSDDPLPWWLTIAESPDTLLLLSCISLVFIYL